MIIAQDLRPRAGRPTAAAVDWKRARCNDGNGTLTHLFFSEDLIDIARAKAICSKCSLARRLPRAALERQEPWGVWGGQLLVNGEHRRPQAQTGPTTETPPARAGGRRGAACPRTTSSRRPDGRVGHGGHSGATPAGDRPSARPRRGPRAPVASRAMAWSRRRRVLVGAVAGLVSARWRAVAIASTGGGTGAEARRRPRPARPGAASRAPARSPRTSAALPCPTAPSSASATARALRRLPRQAARGQRVGGWCPPCQQEMPAFERVHQAMGDRVQLRRPRPRRQPQRRHRRSPRSGASPTTSCSTPTTRFAPAIGVAVDADHAARRRRRRRREDACRRARRRRAHGADRRRRSRRDRRRSSPTRSRRACWPR